MFILLFSLKGKIGRSKYLEGLFWMFILIFILWGILGSLLIFVVAGKMIHTSYEKGLAILPYPLFNMFLTILAAYYSLVCLSIKRMRDMGNSSNLLAFFVGITGLSLLLIPVFLLFPSQTETQP